MRYLLSLYFIAFGVYINSIEAQFNVKVGYGLSYTPANTNQEIVNQFNTENGSRLENEMNAIHLLHGLELGLRYQFDIVGFELSWSSHNANSNGVGEDFDGSLFRKELFYRFNTLKLGLEHYFGNKTIGFSVGQRIVSIRADIAASDFQKTLSKDNQFVLEAYWSINVRGGEYLGLSLRPFIQYPLNTFNFESDEANPDILYELHDHLEITQPTNAISDRLPVVGLSILFYNGLQANF